MPSSILPSHPSPVTVHSSVAATMFTSLWVASAVFVNPRGTTDIMNKLLCPLTGERLPGKEQEQAVVYAAAVPSSIRNACGHVCTFGALMDRLETEKGVFKCPSCNDSYIISVCDGVASRVLCREDEAQDDVNLLAFRYGQQVFWLTVTALHDANSKETAQDRIKEALGAGDDIRVLYRGRAVYPDSTKSAGEISEALLQISAHERKSKKKPSLIVMGKRTGHWGTQAGHVHR